MRMILALVAVGLSGSAIVVSLISGESDVVPFLAALGLVGVAIAWLVGPGSRLAHARILARVLVLLWIGVAIWIAVLLIWYQSTCGCSQPEPIGQPPSIAGVPTVFFHLAATYLGGALVVVAVFSRALGRSDPGARRGGRR